MSPWPVEQNLFCPPLSIKLCSFLLAPPALQLVEVLSPWRLSTQEVLATQIEVFEESQEEDNALTTTPEGLDLNSHEDIFNTLFTKVSVTH